METVVVLKCYSVNPAVMYVAQIQLDINCVECSITLKYVGSDVLLFNGIRQVILHDFLLMI
jgi:hypothetical protein